MLLQPLKQMAQVAASKVAQKAGEVMASKKLFGHADEAQKKIKKKKNMLTTDLKLKRKMKKTRLSRLS